MYSWASRILCVVYMLLVVIVLFMICMRVMYIVLPYIDLGPLWFVVGGVMARVVVYTSEWLFVPVINEIVRRWG